MSLYVATYRERNPSRVHAVARMAAAFGADGFVVIDPSKWTEITRSDIECRRVDTLELALAELPAGTEAVALEVDGTPLGDFWHPEHALYVVGPQNGTLPPELLFDADHKVTVDHAMRLLPTDVVTAIVLRDRYVDLAAVAVP